MEDWLAQLEMDMEPVSTLTGNLYDQSETMEACLEHLAASLGEDLPYPLSADGDMTSAQWEAFDYNVIDQFTSTLNILNDDTEIQSVINNDNDSNNSNDNNNLRSNVKGISQQKQNMEEDNKKKEMSGGAKRKRQPKQIQEHIIAERKRRELLSQLFISLSAIVPDLKKMDKTSILRAAIKYMKQLQDEVKQLKDVAAKRTVESAVVVKKSQFIVDDDDDGGGDDNYSSSATVEYLNKHSVPEIEVKISKKALLLRIYCEEQENILDKLFAELNKHALRITTCSAIPFENLALNITIVAQVKRGFSDNVKDFIRSLHSALSSS